MRVKFHFQTQNKPAILPIYYHAEVKSWFENILKEENISYKAFNFGKPFSNDVQKRLDRFEFEDTPIYWIFSIAAEQSLDPSVFVGKQLVFEDKISRCELWIDGVEWIPKPLINNEAVFKTLTPVCATKSEEDKTLFMSPNYNNYEELLRVSLIDKYQKINGKLPENLDFRCEVKEMLSRTIMINLESVKPGLKVRGFEFEMKLYGSKELIEFAWEAGIGEYTDFGLGMIDIKNS
ncbi:MAG: hypothetical protein KatS3mg035_0777 [Bacteroidia bacterium]|nr:MAG: hypothetical protein KatS3mg035_0777 [Bacteroidia bacterium]